jgi:Thioredoxin
MHILHINKPNLVPHFIKHVQRGSHVFLLVYMDGCGPCNATRPQWAKMESSLRSPYTNNNDVVIAQLNQRYLSPDVIHIVGEIDGFPTMKYIGQQGRLVVPYEEDRSAEALKSWVKSTLQNNTPNDSFLDEGDTTDEEEEEDNTSSMGSLEDEDDSTSNMENYTSSEGGVIGEPLVMDSSSSSGGKRKNKRRASSKTRKSQRGGKKRTKKVIKSKKMKTKTHRKWSQKYKKSINCKRPKGFSQRQYCKYGRKG